MLPTVIAFLVMLNPFALFLYLAPVMRELSSDSFTRVLLRASIISFGIFTMFLITGEFLINNVFRINFEVFRIFGGIVIFSFAYLFIIKGQKAMVQMKEDLDGLASEIALPFMIGAGTLSLTLLMANSFSMVKGILLLIIILSINYLAILGLKYFKDRLEDEDFKVAFDKNMEVLLRLNGFFVGAIGINMIITGIKNVFF